jgi:uracil-DNA glycosylase
MAAGMERAGEHLTDVAASVLRWWNDAGVDMMVDEAPRDWLRAKGRHPGESRGPRSQFVESSHKAVSLDPGFRRDDEKGNAPASRDHTLPDQLNLFQAWLKDHDALPYAAPSARRVCPAGDPTSGLMLMTDMPAAEDCGSGTLISGEAGRLFDRMLAAIGRDRSAIYLASVSCLRSPDGRMAGAHAQQCATLARHHVGLANPRALLLLGDAAGRALLGLTVLQGRGRWHEVQTHAGPVRTILSFAPSFLLTQPSAKALAWADLQMLMESV